MPHRRHGKPSTPRVASVSLSRLLGVIAAFTAGGNASAGAYISEVFLDAAVATPAGDHPWAVEVAGFDSAVNPAPSPQTYTLISVSASGFGWGQVTGQHRFTGTGSSLTPMLIGDDPWASPLGGNVDVPESNLLSGVDRAMTLLLFEGSYDFQPGAGSPLQDDSLLAFEMNRGTLSLIDHVTLGASAFVSAAVSGDAANDAAGFGVNLGDPVVLVTDREAAVRVPNEEQAGLAWIAGPIDPAGRVSAQGWAVAASPGLLNPEATRVTTSAVVPEPGAALLVAVGVGVGVGVGGARRRRARHEPQMAPR